MLFCFFQAEDGIRDVAVTGVQTCALPISRVVVPGVGHFAPARRRLDETGLGGALDEVARAGRPLLGICLGLQLLFDERDRKSTRLNSSHGYISYAVFCLKKKKNRNRKSS